MAGCGTGGGSGCRFPEFDFRDDMTLNELVDEYLLKRGPEYEQKMAEWYGASSYAEACQRAPFRLGDANKADSHQSRFFRTDVLKGYASKLVEAETALKDARTFKALYNRIELALGVTPGCKPLLIYDLTHRLGLHLDRRPVEVWLHRGAREGAERLMARSLAGRHVPLDAFPPEVSKRLTADQAENFFCVAKRWLPGRDRRPSAR